MWRRFDPADEVVEWGDDALRQCRCDAHLHVWILPSSPIVWTLEREGVVSHRKRGPEGPISLGGPT